jgi:hypothetical protein
VTNTTFSAAVRDQLDALKFAVEEWRGELIRYRCSLSAETVRRYRGSLAGWNCRDVRLVLEHLSFADLDPAAQAKLNRVPTRLKLPVEQVDLTIAAGREALRSNDSFQEAVADIRSHARVLDHVLGQQQVASGGAN